MPILHHAPPECVVFPSDAMLEQGQYAALNDMIFQHREQMMLDQLAYNRLIFVHDSSELFADMHLKRYQVCLIQRPACYFNSVCTRSCCRTSPICC